MRIALLTVLISLMVASRVMAAENCDSAPNGEIGIGDCLANNLQAADRELNEIYSKLVSVLKYPERLRKAQRAWVAFRDADCAYIVSGWEDGRGQGQWLMSCKTDMTVARAAELRKFLDDAMSECSQCQPLRNSKYSDDSK
jgi:uncharacterized protein YecT (DUF1311 family)